MAMPIVWLICVQKQRTFYRVGLIIFSVPTFCCQTLKMVDEAFKNDPQAHDPDLVYQLFHLEGKLLSTLFSYFRYFVNVISHD